MLKIGKFEVMGWEHAIRGMRNPKNSWEKSDSYPAVDCGKCGKIEREGSCDFQSRKCLVTHEYDCYEIGPNDYKLMTTLRDAGTDHRKFMRMITVYVDITAPLYWWKEFDTYKVGTVSNSCSTMHKIADKEFTLGDFSCEQLDDIWAYEPGVRNTAPTIEFETITDKTTNYLLGPQDILYLTIKMLNRCRDLYIRTKDKKYWWQMIQLLPSSYNQKRTVMLNYEVLANMYKSRRNHKLDEWHTLCDWIEKLPYSELITGASLEDIPICKEIMNEAKRRAKEEE